MKNRQLPRTRTADLADQAKQLKKTQGTTRFNVRKEMEDRIGLVNTGSQQKRKKKERINVNK